MEKRLQHLRQIFNQTDIQLVIISSPHMISYLTGYFGFSAVEREVFLIITKTKAHLLTDSRYSEATAATVPHFQTHNITHSKRLTDYVLQFAKKDDKIGFESDNLTVAEFVQLKKTKLKFIAISLRELRIAKSNVEIQSIKKAAAIANTAYAKTIHHLVPGITEKTVVSFLENQIRTLGAEVAFPTIVAFGKNASAPHHLSGETKLKQNDLILIDFGAKVDGYCSDCTRTSFIGTVPGEWKKAYQVVAKAQGLAIDCLASSRINHKAEGIPASGVDKVARDYIISQGYPSIPHSLGHGIGLEVHEAPTLSPQSKDILTDGMVFSIEPGIYIPNELGIRIEDLFTIQDSTLIRLT